VYDVLTSAADHHGLEQVSTINWNECPASIGISVHFHRNAHLTVADEGPGIPVELREKVFECYYQVSSGTSRLYEGLGVGLYIARSFARSLGGDVFFMDDDNRWRVRMTIPPAATDWDIR